MSMGISNVFIYSIGGAGIGDGVVGGDYGFGVDQGDDGAEGADGWGSSTGYYDTSGSPDSVYDQYASQDSSVDSDVGPIYELVSDTDGTDGGPQAPPEGAVDQADMVGRSQEGAASKVDEVVVTARNAGSSNTPAPGWPAPEWQWSSCQALKYQLDGAERGTSDGKNLKTLGQGTDGAGTLTKNPLGSEPNQRLEAGGQIMIPTA